MLRRSALVPCMVFAASAAVPAQGWTQAVTSELQCTAQVTLTNWNPPVVQATSLPFGTMLGSSAQVLASTSTMGSSGHCRAELQPSIPGQRGPLAFRASTGGYVSVSSIPAVVRRPGLPPWLPPFRDASCDEAIDPRIVRTQAVVTPLPLPLNAVSPTLASVELHA